MTLPTTGPALGPALGPARGERIALLLDEGSWFETGALALPERRTGKKVPGDGVVTGFGRVDGRTVGLIGIDATVLAGTTAPVSMRKQGRLIEQAQRFGYPLVLLCDADADHERDGRRIRAGDRLFLVQQSANRDAGTFADPDRFDITRPTQPLHVGFGRGIHACLGAQLARIEARVALPKVLDRLGDIRVLGEVAWRPDIASRAVSGLRVGHGQGDLRPGRRRTPDAGRARRHQPHGRRGQPPA